MKRGFITKIRNLLKKVEFNKDSIEIIIEILKIADAKKLDPFHFDLQNYILKPLEEKLPYTFNKMRKMIDADIRENWDKYKDVYKECGFDTKPTTKGLISCLILKLRD